MSTADFPWPRALGEPRSRALIRQAPADFQVSEHMGRELTGGGEHFWVRVRKECWNTAEVAAWLAERAGVARRAVGHSGLKDRHAITEQWFSIHLPGRPDPVLRPAPEGLQVLESGRHHRKLNRGTHAANEFRLVLRQVRGDTADLEARLETVRLQGVPNYFGVQRFGRDQGNWLRGRAWLRGEGEAPRKRGPRGLWLSAVRSWLFNEVLAERVRQRCWDRPLSGDVLQPEGSRGLFVEPDEPQAQRRVRIGEVHPTAPLPGRGGMASSRACRELEERVLAQWSAEIEGLRSAGVDAARRATRLPVAGLSWQWRDNVLRLAFSLPAGAFATSVLEELVQVSGHPGTAPID